MSGAARLSRRAFAALFLGGASAPGLSRVPYGGTLRLAVPWGMSRVDPHALDDPVAALFGAAIADPLYAVDGLGRAYPALASALPEPTAKGLRVRLRPGLVSARGKALSAADVIASFERASRQGATAWLARTGVPARDRADPLALVFRGASAAELATALATPLLSVLPRGYSPLEPDGTGAFAAAIEQGRLVLGRNPRAARGPSFLERVEVRTTADLAEALREFEAGSADVGWLGSGLHRPRPDAVAFRGMPYGFAVLRPGRAIGAWGAPGVMQQLLDGVDPGRLRHLGLEGLPATAGAMTAWGAAPAELAVADDAPQLLLVARTLASSLGRAGHELTVVQKPRAELERRRKTADFALLVDFVRAVGPAGPATQQALLAAQDPELARKPPRLDVYDARSIGRSLPLGVIGELWAAGAHSPRFRGLAGWQLGGIHAAPEP